MALTSVEHALDLVLEDARVTETELVELLAANGRYLAEDIKALRTQPPFDTSAMDGYAVRSSDLQSLPVDLIVIDELPAGHYFDGEVAAGQAVRIFTGAPVPKGTDCIVIQENVKKSGDKITITEQVAKGTFIRASGLDFIEGDKLLNKGSLLDFRCVSLAAAMNHATLPVFKRPIIGILSTGDELVKPGNTTKLGQIISSNSYGIASFVEQNGGTAKDLGIVRDNLQEVVAGIEHAIETNINILVTIGGASVGDHDLINSALKEKDFDEKFSRIAMRPGKPLIFGKLGDISVLGLPGNPVSSLVCSIVFLRPLIQKMLGQQTTQKSMLLPIKDPLPANDQRQDYLRAKIVEEPDGTRFVKVFKKQDSSMLAIFTEADCLVIRPPFAPAASLGALVQTIPI